MQKKIQRIIGLIFLFHCFSTSIFAQSWETVKKIGGSGFEEASSITRDNNGNTYIVGEYNGDITIGSFVLNNPNNNAFLAKLDTNGNTLWAKSFNVAGFGFFNLRYGIEADNNGNVYFTGRFSGNNIANFGNGVTLSPNSGGSNFTQTFIAKFNTNGQAQWARAMSSTSNIFTYERRIAVTGAGDIFIGGSYNGSFQFNNITVFPSVSTEKAFLLKVSTSGNLVWSKQVLPNVATTGFGQDLVMTPDESHVYAVGSVNDGNCFSCAINGFQNSRIYVVKYDTQAGSFKDSLTSEPTVNTISNLNAVS